MARALDVAGYFVKLRDADQAKRGAYVSLSVLKLQKLVYYAQGGHYRWESERLITDEYDRFEAWEYGPKLRSVDAEFGAAGQNNVSEFGSWPPYQKYARSGYFDMVLSDSERETIEAVWSQIGRMDTFDLVRQTCWEAPWIRARESGNLIIAEESIRYYFTRDEDSFVG